MFDAAIAAVAEAAPQVPEIVPVTPGLVVHIDGDYLAYFASGNDEQSPGGARLTALERIEYFKARIGAEKAVVHNTAKGCHKGERFLIATIKPYQGQRDTGRKPKNHAYLQNFLMSYEGNAFQSKTWATREADDGIGAVSHFATGRAPGYAGIATADKDMRMLPGVHINWRTGAVTRVMPGDYDVIGEDGKQYGLKWFFLQMLMGDAADNCPGLEHYDDGKKLARCGEKTAEKLLAGTSTTEEGCRRVLELYSQGYGDHPVEFAMDRFCEQAALMWMRLDNAASVGDFARHVGFSKINHAFDRHVWAAVERLEQRVKIARQSLNELSHSYDPLAADCSAAG